MEITAQAWRMVCNPQTLVGECPLWCAATQSLYFVDIVGCKVFRLAAGATEPQVWDMPEEPGCIGLMSQERLLVALRSGFVVLNTRTGALMQSAPAQHDTRDFRFNDGRCDALGRFWVGTVYEPRTAPLAALYCLERGHLHQVLGGQGSGVTVSNGLAFDTQRGYLYHADTTAHLVRRYPYVVDNVHLGEADVFAQFVDTRPSSDYKGRPDGAAVDSQGHYWSAQFEGARIVRFAPDGSLSGVVHTPIKRPTMVAFGGVDLRTLYMTSACENLSAAEIKAYPLSGAVFALQVDVAGCAEPWYRE